MSFHTNCNGKKGMKGWICDDCGCVHTIESMISSMIWNATQSAGRDGMATLSKSDCFDVARAIAGRIR
jgi:hypothetical protein